MHYIQAYSHPLEPFISVDIKRNAGQRQQEEIRELTTAVCSNPLLPPSALLPSRFHLQALDSVHRAADLEGADALQVLALEVQAHRRLRGSLLLPPIPIFSIHQRRRRRGSNLIQRRIRERGRVMHEPLDQLARLEHRGPRQRTTGRRVCHIVVFLPS